MSSGNDLSHNMENLSVSPPKHQGWYALTCYTVLCKSNANDYRRISRFFLAIYRRYISETSHGLTNVKTINHRDISIIFAISRRDIVLARLRCNDISQSKRYITTIYRCSEVRCNDNVVVNCASTIYRNEAIVYDESVFVYM